MTTSISEIMWRRRMLVEEVINECLSGDITWNLSDIEKAWVWLAIAEWTKDTKYVDYAIRDLTFNRYAREDVRSVASSLAKEVEKLKDAEEFYGELRSKIRSTFYDLLAKCLAEKLPF